jgi:hypothetical protein
VVGAERERIAQERRRLFGRLEFRAREARVHASSKESAPPRAFSSSASSVFCERRT